MFKCITNCKGLAKEESVCLGSSRESPDPLLVNVLCVETPAGAVTSPSSHWSTDHEAMTAELEEGGEGGVVRRGGGGLV